MYCVTNVKIAFAVKGDVSFKGTAQRAPARVRLCEGKKTAVTFYVDGKKITTTTTVALSL